MEEEERNNSFVLSRQLTTELFTRQYPPCYRCSFAYNRQSRANLWPGASLCVDVDNGIVKLHCFTILML